jgi:hypothetical protein
MKITKKHDNGTIYFSELNIGDVFCFRNAFYLRCTTINGEYNAVSLTNSSIVTFANTERVKKTENAELIVEF